MNVNINKKCFIGVAITLFFCCNVFSQQYAVTVVNGYGSGFYYAGETVYAFSRETNINEVFVEWQTDDQIDLVLDSSEWFFAFIMPEEDVTVEAIMYELPDDFLVYEEIQSVNSVKPVYYAIADNAKGSVFIFHGTGGSATGWTGVHNDQQFNLIKDLYYSGYSLVISQCEESTLGYDINGDGKIRWHTFPIDTVNNIDYANMKVLIDTFETRGVLDRDKIFSVGMSSGGAFSAAFSIVFSTFASVTYCASGHAGVMEATESPILFCMMPNDQVIGEDGNLNALANHNLLVNRDICSRFFMNNQFPVYPEYFMRVGLNFSESQDIHNELNTNGFLDANGFLNASPSEIQAHIQMNQSDWPNFVVLPNQQKNAIANLVGVAYGSHNFFSNYNKRTIAFFDNLCETPYQVSFEVSDADSHPLMGVELAIESYFQGYDDNSIAFSQLLHTDADGKAAVLLPDGTYSYTASLIGYHDDSDTFVVDGDNELIGITLSGTPPTLVANPEAHDFGGVLIGHESAPKPFRIFNSGSGTLIIDGVGLDGDDQAMFILTDENEYPEELEMGQEITVLVIFSPDSDGLKSAELLIASGNGEKEAFVIPLVGEGIDPTITIFPWFEDFTGEGFPPPGWSIVNAQGSGTWYLYTDPDDTNAVHDRGTIDEAQEGWLITSPLTIPAVGQFELTFSSYVEYPEDYGKNSLLISTGSGDPSDEDFMEVWTPESVVEEWVETVISLDDYAGQTIYIAFLYKGAYAHAWHLDYLEITAVHTELYALTLAVNPNDAGTVYGSGVYNPGEEVEVTAVPEESRVFVNWTGDIEHVDDINMTSTTVTMPDHNISLTANFAVIGIPQKVSLSDVLIADGDTECFDALQTITVSYFIVEAGGSVTLIAGESVHVLPGTTVEQGGYLLTRIAQHEDDYCGIPRAIEIAKDHVTSKDEDVVSDDFNYEVRENGFFKLYPNPTDCTFTLELTTVELEQEINVEVYTMLGGRLFAKQLPPQRLNTLNLEGQAPGIYIIRVMKGEKVGIERLIKK